MKIVFMGTPDFAAGALEALIKAGHEITAVVTQLKPFHFISQSHTCYNCCN